MCPAERLRQALEGERGTFAVWGWFARIANLETVERFFSPLTDSHTDSNMDLVTPSIGSYFTMESPSSNIWTPLRNSVFRRFWLATVISGSCVAAQSTAIY